MDRHLVDADPDPTFHFDADPDLYPDRNPGFTHVGKTELIFTFIHSIASLHNFMFLVSVIGDIICNILDIRLIFLLEKV